MQEFQKAKTTKVITAIINDQQRRRTCEASSVGSKIPCTSRQDLKQSSVSGDHSPFNGLTHSDSAVHSDLSLGLKNKGIDHANIPEKKHMQPYGIKANKDNGKLSPEFLDGLLVFAPNRRESLLKNFNQNTDFSLGTKAQRRQATVANGWR
jgi:hypothetical protein